MSGGISSDELRTALRSLARVHRPSVLGVTIYLKMSALQGRNGVQTRMPGFATPSMYLELQTGKRLPALLPTAALQRVSGLDGPNFTVGRSYG